MFYIYCITNNINGKNYIGQRKCPANKTPEIDKYMGSGVYLKRSKEKYGIENFSKEILAITEKQENADVLEKVFIKLYRDKGKAEYNIANGGDGGNTLFYASNEVKDLHKRKIKATMSSDEVKNKISLSVKKVFENPDVIEKLRKSHKEAMNRPEVRERCRRSHIGQKISDDTKIKLSNALKGKNTWSKGCKLSEETKEKIRLNSTTAKKVLCVELGLVFNSIKQGAEKLNLDVGSIVKCCKGRIKTTGGYHWEYVK